MSADPLLVLVKYMDAVTVDLKAFTEKLYGDVSSSELEPVLQGISKLSTS
jgi:pyruvate-formate lyase-activating enzyme